MQSPPCPNLRDCAGDQRGGDWETEELFLELWRRRTEETKAAWKPVEDELNLKIARASVSLRPNDEKQLQQELAARRDALWKPVFREFGDATPIPWGKGRAIRRATPSRMDCCQPCAMALLWPPAIGARCSVQRRG